MRVILIIMLTVGLSACSEQEPDNVGSPGFRELPWTDSVMVDTLILGDPHIN